MALKSTVYKFALNVADMDRQIYADHALTVARHPSETAERMMLRVLAFALHASDTLEFGRGISTDDEPDLWQRSLTGEIEVWIDLGTPEPDRLKKACGRAHNVTLYCYGDRAVPVWWDKHVKKLSSLGALQVFQVADADMAALGKMSEEGSDLQVSIQDGEAMVSAGSACERIAVTALQRFAGE